MAKHKKKKSVDRQSKTSNTEYLVGALAAIIVFTITVYSCRNLFAENSYNSLARLLLYGFLTFLAAISAFWYCVGSKQFQYYRFLIIGVFFGIGIYYAMSISSSWYFGGDAGMYLVLTKSLATFQGFVNLNRIEPAPHTLYNLGLPLFLVPFYWLFGFNIGIMNLSIALASIGFIIAFYFLLKDELERYVLILLLLAVGVNFWIVWHAGVIMTEMPFFLFFTWSLVAVNSYLKDENVWLLKLGLVILLAYLAYHTRAVGLALLPAIVLFYILKHKKGKAIAFGLLFTLLFAAWSIRNSNAGGSSYFEAFAKTATMESGTKSLWIEGEGIVKNIFWKPIRLAINGGQFIVPMVFSHFNQAPVKKFLFHVLYIIGMIGLGWHLWKKRYVFDFCIVIIFPAIAIYGGLSYPERWWMLFIPFFLYYLVVGWRVGSQFIMEKTKLSLANNGMKLLLVFLLGWIFATGLKASDIFIQKTHSSRTDTPAGEAYIKAAEWVKENTPPEAIVASRLDKEFYLISDRQGGNSRVWGYEPFTNTQDMQQQVLNAVKEKLVKFDFDYWILDNTRQDSQIAIHVLAENPDITNQMFQVVYGYPAQQNKSLAFVLKINKDWVAEERAKMDGK